MSAAGADKPTLALQVELPTEQLSTWLDDAMTDALTGTGQKRVCQRVLGIKVCGTASWQYDVTRIGPSAVMAPTTDNPQVRLQVPLDVAALVGVSGDAARVLGLSSVPVQAKLALRVGADITAAPDGCPKVALSITPDWISDPTAVLFGKVTFSLSRVIEDVIARQIQPLEARLNHAMNCSTLAQQLQPLIAPCYVNISDERVGPTLAKVQLRQLHWAMPKSSDDTVLSVAVGLSVETEFQVGVAAEDLASRLVAQSCETALKRLSLVKGSAGESSGESDGVRGGESGSESGSASGDKTKSSIADDYRWVTFHHEPIGRAAQPVAVLTTFAALSEYAQRHYDDRLAKKSLDESSVLLSDWSVDGADNGPTAATESTERLAERTAESTARIETSYLNVAADFQAKLPEDQGFLARMFRFFTPKDTVLSGRVSVLAKPVWDSAAHELSLADVSTEITSTDSESTPMMQRAAYELIERTVQKRISEESPWAMADALDNLNASINRTVDNAVASRAALWLDESDQGWTPGTVQLRVDDVSTTVAGLALNANLQTEWRLRLSTRAWPTVSWQNVR